MYNKYIDLVTQTFDFPQEGFEIKNHYLYYNQLDFRYLIEKYKTPLKISFLPKIGWQIDRAKRFFKEAFRRHKYPGAYHYCYCTKSNHFSFIMQEVLKHDVHIETSSAFDIDIILKLHQKKRFSKDNYIICNGFKSKSYTSKICKLINRGFHNTIAVLDNTEELQNYKKQARTPFNIGIRVAADEEPSFPFYTSRLGIPSKDILDFYLDEIKDNPKYSLKMLHIFLNKGIKDDLYYWSELNKIINLYCKLKKICPELSAINIGGGFPIKHSLGFEYNYQFITNEIVANIKKSCKKSHIPCPDIFTEFGSFTVGESMIHIYEVLQEKKQNDSEHWYMIDSSFITTLPDTWGIGEKFLLLPINKWDREYQKVHLGGMTCDSHDYYDSEEHINQVFLPKTDAKEPLYLGFFHTGAYQDQISGYGGIKHCLIPSPKHILVDIDEKGNFTDILYAKEQSAQSMLKILGY